ncbi:MAG: hypothetical protein IKX70_03545 [Treponema sp.]|nr:hypothetical protein [Treponema sp.]
MKKFFYNILIAAFVLTCVSCASTGYVEKNYSKNVELLKTCEPYAAGTKTVQKEYLVDEQRARELREYFKENAGLDLDALAASDKSTWEKSVELAVFVAKNIPHDNQKKFLKERNAITLWEYSRQVPTGFNCRWHSTLLSELLLSIGIRNSFITCLPYDKNDGDCHVVNIVWLPELEKWAMIDSDMVEYVTGEDGVPLSLQEMREYIQNDIPFTVNVLPGFEDSWVAKPSGLEYMQAYWAKNLYWFQTYMVYAFDLEYAYDSEGARVSGKYYASLLPGGDDEAFWSY